MAKAILFSPRFMYQFLFASADIEVKYRRMTRESSRKPEPAEKIFVSRNFEFNLKTISPHGFSIMISSIQHVFEPSSKATRLTLWQSSLC